MTRINSPVIGGFRALGRQQGTPVHRPCFDSRIYESGSSTCTAPGIIVCRLNGTLLCRKLWISLGLVDLSRIPSGIFFSGGPSWHGNGKPK